MTYTAVMNVIDNRVAKFKDGFETQADAQAHLDAFKEDFPNAFYTDPAQFDGPIQQWWVEGFVITIVPLPPPEPPMKDPIIREILDEMDLIKKRLATLEKRKKG